MSVPFRLRTCAFRFNTLLAPGFDAAVGILWALHYLVGSQRLIVVDQAGDIRLVELSRPLFKNIRLPRPLEETSAYAPGVEAGSP